MMFIRVSLVAVFAALPLVSLAAIPSEYTMANIFTATHDAPRTFNQLEGGGFAGMTETGKLFSQVIITNDQDIRLHKFSIDSAYFYVSDKGLITADNDLRALSIYLSLV